MTWFLEKRAGKNQRAYEGKIRQTGKGEVGESNMIPNDPTVGHCCHQRKQIAVKC